MKTQVNLMVLAFTALSATAITEKFNFPLYEENSRYRLDWCLNWSDQCGKPAADRFCRVHLYDYARDFVKDNNIGIPTKTIGSQEICNHASCDGFKYIVCASRKHAVYSKPTYHGFRLDYCKNWAKDCGTPAADAFCKTQGYTRSGRWVKDNNIGEMTKTIGSNDICDASYCDGFKSIECL